MRWKTWIKHLQNKTKKTSTPLQITGSNPISRAVVDLSLSLPPFFISLSLLFSLALTYYTYKELIKYSWLGTYPLCLIPEVPLVLLIVQYQYLIMLQDDWGTYKYVYYIHISQVVGPGYFKCHIPAYYILLPTFLGGSTSTKKWHKKYQKDKKQGFFKSEDRGHCHVSNPNSHVLLNCLQEQEIVLRAIAIQKPACSHFAKFTFFSLLPPAGVTRNTFEWRLSRCRKM